MRIYTKIKGRNAMTLMIRGNNPNHILKLEPDGWYRRANNQGFKPVTEKGKFAAKWAVSLLKEFHNRLFEVSEAFYWHFCLENFEAYGGDFSALADAAMSAAVEVVEDCPESYDSAVICTFADGSRLYIGNPREAAFQGFSYEV